MEILNVSLCNNYLKKLLSTLLMLYMCTEIKACYVISCSSSCPGRNGLHMVEDPKNNSKHHLNNPQNHCQLHLVRVLEEKFVLSCVPDLHSQCPIITTIADTLGILANNSLGSQDHFRLYTEFLDS